LYFIIKYNVFNKYIIYATTTAINTYKKVFDFGQREVISVFTLVTNKGEHSICCSRETNIVMVGRGEKRSNAVKGAISLNR
jgi:hypothetical protein